MREKERVRAKCKKWREHVIGAIASAGARKREQEQENDKEKSKRKSNIKRE